MKKMLIDYDNPDSLAYRFRKRRIKWLVELVRFVVQQQSLEEVRICDIGGTGSYWRMFPFDEFQGTCFSIDLINLEYPDYDRAERLADNVVIHKLIGNACELCDIQDANYHIAHSNSVIEHVGGGHQVEAMAREMRRVARYYYIQTPNYWFPIEPHFFVPFYAFFPRPVRVWLQMHMKGKALVTAIYEDDGVRLLTRKEMQYLFPDGKMLIERFMGVAKSIVVRSPCKKL